MASKDFGGLEVLLGVFGRGNIKVKYLLDTGIFRSDKIRSHDRGGRL